ncbi:hypothetical protein [Oricola sp.]|uniref:hypothetical protein n=1 Tax=Oricola sp. TaxID=1979950 RepID=UPI0025D5CE2F|nr:hypothetical protein [Oricola sp.]MCI5078527.1 hypothetical protein [Oricola sp.]
MTDSNRPARIAAYGTLAASALVLSGCLGPTYGTDKPAMTQFMEDIGSSMTLGGGKRTRIDYKPRPGLVEPSDTSVLPPPQQNIAEASQEWPESPEERLQRIKKEIDEGRELPALTDIDDPDVTVQTTSRQVATANQRVYLTDPPTEYRQPAQTAAYGELGETEATKERRRKKAAEAGEKPGGWRRFVPWL